MIIMSLLLLTFIVFMAMLRDEQKKRNRAEYQPPVQYRSMTPEKKPIYTTPGGEVYNRFIDMLSQSHLLIAGCQGSGKSVAINGLIDTILHRHPSDKAFPGSMDGAQMILIDPKCTELSYYENMPHTLAYSEGFNPQSWYSALYKAVAIMESRKQYMKSNRLRKYDRGDLYVIVDEWATIYKNGGKDTFNLMMRLVCEGRAEKVHVIMATQVPKANIIPTEIRENFDARLCLRTTNAIQSRVIMEENGCEDLPRYGQGFYLKPEGKEHIIVPYVTEEAIDKDIEHWNDQMKLNGIIQKAVMRCV